MVVVVVMMMIMMTSMKETTHKGSHLHGLKVSCPC